MSLKTIKLLIVEDNKADYRLVAEYLKESASAKFEVVHFDNLSDALKSVKTNSFDIVLLDICLPDSSGLSIIDEVRAADPEIAIIVLTGLNDAQSGIEALHKGAQDYLVKGSFQSEILIKTILFAIERKTIKRELKQSEEKYRILFNSMSEGFILFKPVLDAEGKLIDIEFLEKNKIIDKINDLYNNNHCCEKIKEILLELDPKTLNGLIQAGSPARFEIKLEEMERWYTIYMYTPMKGEIAALFLDITDHKKAETILKRDKETFEKMVGEKTEELIGARIELERSRHLSDIGTLSATVAHELRNPLTVMRLSLSNIRKKLQNTEDIEGNLQRIEKKILESDQIIDNLLVYTKIRGPKYQKINSYEILKECTDTKIEQAGNKISFLEKFSKLKDVSIEADPLQLKEVFSNILNNACDAVSENDGRIEISGFDEDNMIRVWVQDNGIGIDGKEMEKLFSPFFTTKNHGTGLGLSVCKQIINLHGGSIIMESIPNDGTIVKISLPKRK